MVDNTDPKPEDEIEDILTDLIIAANNNTMRLVTEEATASTHSERGVKLVIQAKQAIQSHIDRVVAEARIDEIMELVVASGWYPTNHQYSQEPFYCVGKPAVDKRLAQLKSQEIGEKDG